MSPKQPSTQEGLESKVIDVIANFVGEIRGGQPSRQIKANDSLEKDLGIGSLERVELFLRLERTFDIHLGERAMTEVETPSELTSAILEMPGVAERWPNVKIKHAPGPAVTAPSSARTVVDALEWHAQNSPNRTHMYLREQENNETVITYGALWQSSLTIATALRAMGLGRGNTIAIMLRTEKNFFPTFLGSLIAGCTPVPLYPPFRADRITEYSERQVGILRNAGCSLMITFSDVERMTALFIGQVPSLTTVTTPEKLLESIQPDTISMESFNQFRSESDAALIQYTSGSTGQPKGVLLSHSNLLSNIRALQAGLEVKANDVVVSWLPLYHDMGLIGAWLGTLYVGAPLVLMSPLAFLARPSRWLWSLHSYGGTFSQAPNFAYELCSQRIADSEIEGLDLSSVRTLLNGAEAVHPETLSRFTARFSAYGLKPETLTPVYGLAECSVGLAVPPLHRTPVVDIIDRHKFQQECEATPSESSDSALRFVSCGRALPEHEIRIVNGDGQPVPERREGQVQFRGPSATSGYYRNPEATRELIRADGWLETGDLGYLANGELFITARQKDLIIKGGRNLQPHEAEEIVGAIPSVRKGCVAAFGMVDRTRGTEKFVIVSETRLTEDKARAALESEIIEHVTSALGIPPDIVVLSKPGSVLKTSSGKIRRGATREAYTNGALSKSPQPQILQWIKLALKSGLGYVSQSARQLDRLLFTIWVATLVATTSFPVWLTILLGPSGTWVNRLVGKWARMMFRLGGCQIRVVGQSHLDKVDQAVYVANHASYLDPILMMAVLPGRIRFAAKARLSKYPFLGTAIRKGGHIRVEKRNLSQQFEGARAIVKPLQHGESLFLFPEGTFVAAPGLLPFRLGAFQAAAETGCPIVPITIQGTRHMFPAGTIFFRRTPITVIVSEPLKPNGSGWPEIVRLRDEAFKRIAKYSDE